MMKGYEFYLIMAVLNVILASLHPKHKYLFFGICAGFVIMIFSDLAGIKI